jgi:multiple sugar transport system ATP-binding protein
MPSVVLDGVSLSRGDVVALNEVSLSIDNGELATVVGPSGSGKTTLLRVIAGLEQPTAGRLLIDGTDVRGIPPADRDLAMVFQDHALYPHKTAERNLSFPLEVRQVEEPKRSTRVAEVAHLMGLDRVLDRRPKTLSQGRRNALATGRALVRDPKIMLLDEPLASFDAQARLQARLEIRRRHEQSGATTFYATNEQSEAMAIGDRTIVLNRGMVQQVDTPTAIYREPVNLFVARFIGSPPMNAITGRLEPDYPDYHWVTGDERLLVPTSVVEAHPRLHEYMGRSVVMGIRPEHVHPAVAEPFETCLHGVCVRIEDLGGVRLARVDVGHGDEIVCIVDRDPIPGVGNPVELAVDVNRLYFFDPETGAAL